MGESIPIISYYIIPKTTLLIISLITSLLPLPAMLFIRSLRASVVASRLFFSSFTLSTIREMGLWRGKCDYTTKTIHLTPIHFIKFELWEFHYFPTYSLSLSFLPGPSRSFIRSFKAWISSGRSSEFIPGTRLLGTLENRLWSVKLYISIKFKTNAT